MRKDKRYDERACEKVFWKSGAAGQMDPGGRSDGSGTWNLRRTVRKKYYGGYGISKRTSMDAVSAAGGGSPDCGYL